MQAQQRRRQLEKQRLGFVNQLCLAFRAGQVAALGEFAQQEVGERHGLGNQAVELFLAVSADVAVRVFVLRQEDEAEALVVGEGFERVFQGAPGSLAAGIVAVETEDDTVDLAQQLVYVRCRGCRAEGSNGIADAVLGECDDVHVAFGDDRGVGIAERLAGLRQAE